MAISINSTRFPVSAREQYFRVARYYRKASFFIRHNASDPRLSNLLNASLADFQAAIKLLPQPAHYLWLNTTQNFTVPVYFYPAKQTQSSQQQKICFIPEWREAVMLVVDYVATRDDVDVERLGLGGISYGGLLAPLAVTQEHRFAAVLTIDGMLNLQQLLETEFPLSLTKLASSGNRTAFNAAVEEAYSVPGTSTTFRWAVDQGTWLFDTPDDPYEWYEKTGAIYLDEAKLQQDSLPCLCWLGAEHQLGMVTLDWLVDVFDWKTGNSTTTH
ncbi:hypothetical protein DV736_g6582, partial [Chaetothyriales sp. CBS 134916]